MANRDTRGLVCLRVFRDLPQGELARSRLVSEGVAAQLADEYVVGLNWLWSQAVGGVSVLVPEADARDAVTVLAKDRTEDLLTELGLSEHEIETCPSCGSVDVAYRSRRVALGAWLALGLWFHLLAPFLMVIWFGLAFWILSRPRWRCRMCHTTFRELWIPGWKSSASEEDRGAPPLVGM